MKLHSLKDLYVEELRDLYSAEKQLVQALPKLAEAVSSSTLRKAFEMHLEETRGQIERLDQIFKNLGGSPGGHKCEAMAGIIKEGQELLEADADPDVLDAAIIAAAQRAEHYEIAGYGCARTYANMLGRKGDVTLLQETLDEESSTDRKLTDLAERHINEKALTESE
jgi:ferritin-like metal-binding protein YciE